MKGTEYVNVQFFLILVLILFGFMLGNLSRNINLDTNFSKKFIDTKLLPVHDKSNAIVWTNTKSVVNENTIFQVKTISETITVDQGQWGSCTAFQMKYAYMFWLAKANKPIIEPSTSYWYAKSRQLLNNTNLADIGSTTTSTLNVLRLHGTISEVEYPYSSFNIFNKNLPTSNLLFSSGIQSPIVLTGNPQGFKKLPLVVKENNIPLWKTQADYFCSEIDLGRSILISILVYKNWMTVDVFRSGIISTPRGSCIGAHAICLSGYNKSKQVFTFYNSWGYYTGNVNNKPGLFSIPFSYAANSSRDNSVRASISSDWWSL